MKFLPVAINIQGKKILLIGGGETALKKMICLRPFTRRLTVLAKEISPRIKATRVRFIKAAYSACVLKGYDIVFACTNYKTLNQRIRRDAKALGLLVNVVDNPKQSDFISSAIYKKGPMTIAVNSDGDDIKRTIALRNKIKAMCLRHTRETTFKKALSLKFSVERQKKSLPILSAGTSFTSYLIP